MTYILMYCWAVYSSSQACVTPTAYPTKAQCQFVLNNLHQTQLKAAYDPRDVHASGRCVGVK